MDIQILDLDMRILASIGQILDLHIQIQDLDIRIPDFRQGPAEKRNFISQPDTAAFSQEITATDQTNAFLISRSECIQFRA